MQHSHNNLLLQACRTLFGQDIVLSQNFLAYLQPDGAKIAYRSQVKAHHPDRFTNAPPQVREQQTERFRDIHQAYTLLKDFLDNRQKIRFPKAPTARPRTAQPYRSPHPQHRQATQPSTRSQSLIPNIPLEYGMFVYYSGKIAYHDLIRGLIWQRKQRPSIGTIARHWGWLNEQQVNTILKQRGPSQRFGKKAVELKHLRPHQVESLLTHQRSRQRRLGHYFVNEGLMSQREADELARKLKQHNARLRR